MFLSEAYNFLEKKITYASAGPSGRYDTRKKRPLDSILMTGAQILADARNAAPSGTPVAIQCIEATFLSLLLTQGCEEIFRFPISFHSVGNKGVGTMVEEDCYHIVLGVYVKGKGFGTLGVSRQPCLGSQALVHESLEDLITVFMKGYQRFSHCALSAKVGRLVPHYTPSDLHTSEIVWTQQTLMFGNHDWAYWCAIVERELLQAMDGVPLCWRCPCPPYSKAKKNATEVTRWLSTLKLVHDYSDIFFREGIFTMAGAKILTEGELRKMGVNHHHDRKKLVKACVESSATTTPLSTAEKSKEKTIAAPVIDWSTVWAEWQRDCQQRRDFKERVVITLQACLRAAHVASLTTLLKNRLHLEMEELLNFECIKMQWRVKTLEDATLYMTKMKNKYTKRKKEKLSFRLPGKVYSYIGRLEHRERDFFKLVTMKGIADCDVGDAYRDNFPDHWHETDDEIRYKLTKATIHREEIILGDTLI